MSLGSAPCWQAPGGGGGGGGVLGQNRWRDNSGQMWSVESGGEGKTAALAGGRYWLPLRGGPALMESHLLLPSISGSTI